MYRSIAFSNVCAVPFDSANVSCRPVSLNVLISLAVLFAEEQVQVIESAGGVNSCFYCELHHCNIPGTCPSHDDDTSHPGVTNIQLSRRSCPCIVVLQLLLVVHMQYTCNVSALTSLQRGLPQRHARCSSTLRSAEHLHAPHAMSSQGHQESSSATCRALRYVCFFNKHDEQ